MSSQPSSLASLDLGLALSSRRHRPEIRAVRSAPDMPAPHGRDLERTRERLAEWLASELPDPHSLELSEPTDSGTTGFSNDTLRFDLDNEIDTARQRESLVARMDWEDTAWPS